ncbi:plasmid-partitioning protein SopA, partial [Klebsiella pneumoniae]
LLLRVRKLSNLFHVLVAQTVVYKPPSAVHEAQWLALQGHRVLLIEGNDPQGTASMYHGYVPDLHIHAEDTLLPFYLGERDNAE